MTIVKPSPHYRSDSHDGLAPEARKYLDEHFLKDLTNRERVNPKLLVVFSGGNAVGKSSLSHKLQQELGGVILENDVVKLHILKYKPDIDRDALQHLTWQYTMDLYGRASRDIKNGLIIRDGVIDWYYDRILPIFEQQGYELFVVAYDLYRTKLIDLITKRGDKPTVGTARLIAQLDDHVIHQKRFRSVYSPDITLTDETVFDYDKVVFLLKQRLRGLQK